MKLGIIGAGSLGTALGECLAEAGHEIMYGGGASAQDAAVRQRARVGSNAETAAYGDVVILAVPFAAIDAALADARPLSGRILWSCVNALKPDYTGLAIGFDNSAAEEVARRADGARVVAALPPFAHAIASRQLRYDAELTPTVFVCGDDAAAKGVIEGLVKELGADPVDAGPLRAARLAEPAMMLAVSIAYSGVPRDVGIRLLSGEGSKSTSEQKEGAMSVTNEPLGADHRMRVDTISSTPKKVLIVVANPTTATTVGWRVGFWGAELTHPYYELTEHGVEVTIASPNGGKVEMDALSDPRDESKWSAEDLITMGFVNSPELMALLEDTPKLADLTLDDFDAIMVAGGLAPMFSFRDDGGLKDALRRFYEAEKPTCIYCHGTAALVDLKLSDGSYLVEGKTVTGFSNAEEDYSDRFVGQRVMPFRLEDEFRKRGANYVQGGLFKAFVVRDGRLITGQQQYSGRKVAQQLIEVLGL